MKSIQTRARQRGFSNPQVLWYSVLILTIFVGCIAAAIGSFVGVRRLFNDKGKGIATSIVACFWVWLWMHWSFWGDGPQKMPMRMAISACEAELAQLPKHIEVDGILDEAAALDTQNILNLLSLRRLKFVEVKVQLNQSQQPRITNAHSEVAFNLKPDTAVGSYFKLELSAKGDPQCLPDSTLHTFTARALALPPFLPDTCIKASTSDKPTARYSISHFTSIWSIHSLVGNWVLSERSTTTVLARISTYGDPNKGNLGNPATIVERSSLSDCRASHAILADRLFGADTSIEGNPQLVTEKVVSASAFPSKFQQEPNSYPKAKALSELTRYNDQEHESIQNRGNSLGNWQNAVAQAKQTGWAGFGSQVLDWKKRELVSLQLRESADSAYPWSSIAGDDGFWVLTTGATWSEQSDNLLAHYASNGNLRWISSIQAPSKSLGHGKCTLTPQSMQFTGRHLFIHSSCRRIADLEEGMAWRIDRSDLPSFKAIR